MKRASHRYCQQIASAFSHSGRAPEGFGLRLASPGDLDEILNLGTKAFDYNAPTRRELRHAIRKTHGGLFLLIAPDMGLAGYMLLEAHARRQNIYINTTALDARYRGQGLGALLYDFKEFLARSLAARSIWCHVAENNNVNIHLLRKNGYEEIRREQAYYEDGRAAIVLRKTILP